MTKTEIQIEGIKKDIMHLTQLTKEGFAEIHKRQDIANGKLMRHENNLTKLNSNIGNCLTIAAHEKIESTRLKENVGMKDKLVFYFIGIGGSIIAGVMVFTISHFLMN